MAITSTRILFATIAALLLGSSMANGDATNVGQKFVYAELPWDLSVRGETVISVANPAENDAIADVTITNESEERTFSVDPGQSVQETFPPRQDTTLGPLKTKGPVFQIVSSVDVAVTAPPSSFASVTASTLFPLESVGKEYRIVSHRDSFWTDYGTQFGVVAIEDGDTVVRSFDQEGQLVDEVTLSLNELFQRRNTDEQVTAWKIVADKPVAVFSGARCSFIEGFYCDPLTHQLLPEKTLSSTYITCPSMARPAGCVDDGCAQDLFKYIATEDDTTINYFNFTQGDAIMSKNFGEGEFIDVFSNKPSIVTADKPFYAYQFLISALATIPGFPQPGEGDPALTVIPPVEQFLSSYTFPTTATYRTSIHVTAETGTILTLDGVELAPISCDESEANQLDDKIFCCAQFPIDNESSDFHSVSGDKPFGITISGIGGSTALMYVGGMGLAPINEPCEAAGGPNYIVDTSRFTLDGSPMCDGDMTPSSIRWSSSDSEISFIDASVEDPRVCISSTGRFDACLEYMCGLEPVKCCTSLYAIFPDITCPDVQILQATSNCQAELPELRSLVAIDNRNVLDDVQVFQNIKEGTKLDVGTYDIEFTAVDKKGKTNIKTCPGVVQVVDAEPVGEIDCGASSIDICDAPLHIIPSVPDKANGCPIGVSTSPSTIKCEFCNHYDMVEDSKECVVKPFDSGIVLVDGNAGDIVSWEVSAVSTFNDALSTTRTCAACIDSPSGSGKGGKGGSCKNGKSKGMGKGKGERGLEGEGSKGKGKGKSSAKKGKGKSSKKGKGKSSKKGDRPTCPVFEDGLPKNWNNGLQCPYIYM